MRVSPLYPRVRRSGRLVVQLLAAVTVSLSAADSLSPSPAASRPKRIYRTVRLEGPPPQIDGRLDDACWQGQGAWAGNFTQLTPHHGGAPRHATEIKILYDDRHLYVAMRAYDDPPAQRSRQAGNRDSFTGDIMGVNFDSYHDQRTGFEFDLTASGQKLDLRLFNDGWDTTWNAVWSGQVAHETDCWTAEFLIPLSQLRYDPRNSVWGLHAWRWIDRLKEESNWNLLANDDTGNVKSFGELHGLTGLPSRRRYEVVPYGSVRYATQAGGGADTEFRAGVDAKLGLSSNLTLDASVQPDFGQVEADPAVMNLTAFETFLTERRALFLEGKDIFDFTFADDPLFYSRRIGQPPAYRPAGAVGAQPESTTLLGALKLTGKTGRGFSFGVLGAMTDREHVIVSDAAGTRAVAVAPRAAQLVWRGQQDLRDGDTVVGGIVTHVRRDLATDALAAQLPEEATAVGLDVTHHWADREYFLRAVGVVSDVRGDPRAISRLQLSSARYYQRPVDGGSAYDPTRDRLSGQGFWLQGGKGSKGRWRWQGELLTKSPGLEFNDLGYLARADRIGQAAAVSFIEKVPARWYRSYALTLEQENEWTMDREHLGTGLDLEASVDLRNKWSIDVELGWQGAGRDPVALRGGPLLRVPEQGRWSAAVSTNSAKRVFGKIYAKGSRAQEAVFSSAGYGGKVSVRPVPALLLSLSADATRQTDRQRYAPLKPTGGGSGWFVSRQEGESRSVALRAEWHLRPELSLQYYGNPFGSTVRHAEFRRVRDPEAAGLARRLGPVVPGTRMDGQWRFDEDGDGAADYLLADPDGNGASFHSNLVLRWEYRRGSQLYLVWAQQREGAEAGRGVDAWSAFTGLRERPPSNQFMLKVTYWFSS